MTLIDGPKGDNQICVGYKNEFDLINEKNGDTLQLYQVDSSKVSRPFTCPSRSFSRSTGALVNSSYFSIYEAHFMEMSLYDIHVTVFS